MIKYILIILFLLVFNCVNAQTPKHKCATHLYLNEALKNSKFKTQYDLDQDQLANEELVYDQNSLNKAGTIYTIPVVFHVLHNGGTENINDAQIEDALRILNRDYRKQNPDANSVVSNFQSLVADIEIEFAFATIAPDGTCFKGITRTKSPRTVDTDSDDYDGNDQLEAILDGNDVYQGYWDPSKYLNIYVCKSIGGAAGYTNYPSNFSTGSMRRNGIYVLSNYVGSINTSSDYTSRTLTHEVGHWLNLPHTWGSTNNPDLQSNCSTDDGISDTPNTIGVQSCNLSESTCGVLANVENYMDYSYCSKMFTTGQKSRMRTALTSSIAGRNNLWKPSNLSEVGATSNLPLCKADFSSQNNIICSGNDVHFIDESIHGATSWAWSFPGGTPSTSTMENPVVNYNNSGDYSVSLTVSNGVNSLSVSKSDYVKVLNETGIAPIQEGFENSSFIPSSKWFVIGNEEEESWELTSLTSASGNKSVKIDNRFNSTGGISELISTTTTLDLNLSASISFDYAYARKEDGNTDKLKLFVSNDCGQTWFLKKSLSGSALRTATNTSSNFIPNDSEWKTAVVNSSSLTNFLESDFRMKFVFESGGGNNVYLDNINIDGPVSIFENKFYDGFSLFPNPTNGELNITFNNLKKSNYKFKIMDVVGKEFEEINVSELSEGVQSFKINTEKYSAGAYIISVSNEFESKLFRFVVR